MGCEEDQRHFLYLRIRMGFWKGEHLDVEISVCLSGFDDCMYNTSGILVSIGVDMFSDGFEPRSFSVRAAARECQTI